MMVMSGCDILGQDGMDVVARARYETFEELPVVRDVRLDLGMARHLSHALRKRETDLARLPSEITLSEYCLTCLLVELATSGDGTGPERDGTVEGAMTGLAVHVGSAASLMSRHVTEDRIRQKAHPLEPAHFERAADALVGSVGRLEEAIREDPDMFGSDVRA